MSRPDHAFIIIEKGEPYKIWERVVIDADKVLIGRATEDHKPHLSFANGFISRNHAEIVHRGDAYFVIDHSKHGLIINGIKANKNIPCELKHNDRIGLAGNEVVFIFCIGAFSNETLSKSGVQKPEIRLDEAKRELVIEGEPIALTGKLYALFEVLYQNRGRIVSNPEIKKSVWPERQVQGGIPLVGNEEVSMMVKRLRDKLKSHRQCVCNKRGCGYLLQ
jgi:DNA-binding winged helix-turn-helix (wHTH) protein